ncbi:hypothetical protein LIER_35230 [Lithospermum erythrorhizon]|uniref:Transposase MuDR plant domain-containing protein n=1 Tax=Lithospermum erythrorhizon TaxID=34254 RepID=A0AAV3NM38_LITER
MNVDQGVEEGGSASHHTKFFSSRVHEQLEVVDGDIDLGSDNEDLRNDKSSSDDERAGSRLDSFLKYNRKTDDRHPKFALGMLFGSREELKSAIDTYSIKIVREIRYVKNEKKRVRVVCKDKECEWFIYAKQLSGETGLQIRKWHLDHTCMHVYDNKTLKSSWLVRHYKKKAKATALKSIYGDEDKKFERLWDYYIEVIETNPGTSCYVKTIENEEGAGIFQRWYMCCASCKEGFRSGCINIVGVDGCFLKTKRGGQLLVVVGIDSNKNIFLIAYGLVEVYNKNSWE